MPIWRFSDFSGRSCRREFWLYLLGYAVLLFVCAFLSGVLNLMHVAGGQRGVGFVFIGIFAALLIPTIAVQVRRLHDQDRTGWLVLLTIIPYIGAVIVLVLMALPGTIGENRYGVDPVQQARDTKAPRP